MADIILTVVDEKVEISAEGAELITPLVKLAQDAVDLANTAGKVAGTAIAVPLGDVRDVTPLLLRAGFLAASDGAFNPTISWLTTPRIAGVPGAMVRVSGVSQTNVCAVVAYREDGTILDRRTPSANGVTSLYYSLPAGTASYAVTLADPGTYPNYPTWYGENGVPTKVPMRVTYFVPADALGDLSRYFVLFGYMGVDGVEHVTTSNGGADPNVGSFWRRTPPLPVKRGMVIEFSAYNANGVAHLVYRKSDGSFLSSVPVAVASSVGGIQTGASIVPDLAASVEASIANQKTYPDPAANGFASTFRIRAVNGLDRPGILSSANLVVLYGDSRFSTVFPINQEAWSALLPCEVQNNGLSGHTVAQNASDADLANVFTLPGRDPSLIVWLPGGNDVGRAGTIGTFSAGTANGQAGEAVVAPLPIGTVNPAAGTAFVQSIDLAIRKIEAKYSDVRARSGLTGSETEAAKQAKLRGVIRPRLVVLTDLPQQRIASASPAGVDASEWGDPANWERKRQAIIEACRRNRVELVDTMADLPVHFGPQPPVQGTTTVYGDDFYDWLHPYLLHVRLAKFVIGRLGVN